MIGWLMRGWPWIATGLLTSVMLASQIQQIGTFSMSVECTRRFIYPQLGDLVVTLTVPCPADLTLCDRILSPLADGTLVRGCPGPFTVTTLTLPNVECGQPYIGWFAAIDGVPPYSWSLGAGTLPTGLILNSDGSITGTVPLSDPECQSGVPIPMNPETIFSGG